jgi:hypothetical protein
MISALSLYHGTATLVLLGSIALSAAFFAIAVRRLWCDCIRVENEARALTARMEKLELRMADICLAGPACPSSIDVQRGGPSPNDHAELGEIRTALNEAKDSALQANRAARTALRAVRMQNRRYRAFEEKYSRVAQPRWRVAGQFLHRTQHEVTLQNLGAPAVDVSAECDGQTEASVVVSAAPVVKTGESLRLLIVFNGVRPPEFRFALAYLDSLRERRRLWLTVSELAVTLSGQEAATPSVAAVR